MDILVSGGCTENGIVIGNAYDKYGSKNPIEQWMMGGFCNVLSHFLELAKPATILDVGCGEGYWVLRWQREGFKARGLDVSSKVILLAQENAAIQGLPASLFSVCCIYNIQKYLGDRADLVVCCEVLEHLENPEAGLQHCCR